jgi:uncharacterized protein YndB with AHSA1/START domain
MSDAPDIQPPFVMKRVIEAPRHVVFEALTKGEYVSRWFAPQPLTMPKCDVDFRPGGAFRFVMRTPDGVDYPFDGEFGEIVAPERIVFRGAIHDRNVTVTTLTFAEHDGQTTLTVEQAYSFQSDTTRGAPEGWRRTLDQLANHAARAR